MKTRLIVLGLAMTSVAALVAQAPQATQATTSPAFDVAAIKPSANTQAFCFSMVQPGGRYIGQNMSLRLLIKTAYGVHDSQIVSGPSWIDSDHWDINAKAEGYKTPRRFAIRRG